MMKTLFAILLAATLIGEAWGTGAEENTGTYPLRHGECGTAGGPLRPFIHWGIYAVPAGMHDAKKVALDGRQKIGSWGAARPC